jgi:hypothetical protein
MWKEVSESGGQLDPGIDAGEDWHATPVRWLLEAEGVMRDGWERIRKVFKGSGKEKGLGFGEL